METNRSCEKHIQAAKRDWRDVINSAEYPEATSVGLLEYIKLDERSRQKLDQRDLEQYLAWLNKERISSQSPRIWNKVLPWRRNK